MSVGPEVWTDALLDRAEALKAKGLTWKEVGAKFGKSATATRVAVYRRSQKRVEVAGEREEEDPAVTDGPREQVTDSASEQGRILEARRSNRIRTLDHLLEVCEVDLERWEVYRHVLNKWEVGANVDGEIIVEPLWQVKAWLRPLQPLVDAKAIVAGLLDDLKNHAPNYRKPKYPKVSDPHLLALSIADHHFGLLAWGEETGDDYDIDLADRILDHALEQLLSYVTRFEVEKILFVAGNDWLHADQTIEGAGGATTKGTSLDVDTRRQKMYLRAFWALVRVIERLRMIAPTEVVVVPGNHDKDSMFTLGHSVWCWFHADEAVTIRNEPTPHRYFRYCNTLIGLAHGDEAPEKDLAVIMATDVPELWAETSHHEWWTAHTHRKREVKYVSVDEDHGVRVRVMPSLVARDQWHAEKGYKHKRAAECYLYHPERDYVGHFSVGVPPELRSN